MDALDAGVEHGIEVDAAHGDDPQEIEAERPQVPQGVGARTEGGVEQVLGTLQGGLAAPLKGEQKAHVGVSVTGLGPVVY